MTDYTNIIRRLTEAEGPSRDLDWEVYASSGLEAVGMYGDHPHYTASLDVSIALCKLMLPGWGWRVATCCVSDDAWVFPDFNSPIHGDRLKRDFAENVDWVELTDVDLRPSGKPAVALLISMFTALDYIAGRALAQSKAGE